jgi:hypothetical protein
LALLAGTTLVATGCFLRPLPPPEEILRVLSYAILQPETTCAELRADFGLEDLPLVDTPDQIGISYEEHRLPTSDGQTLRVWYMPANDQKGVVVVSPGNTGPMPCYLFTAWLLTQTGWTAVMYDYQGFGGSSGQPDLRALRSDLETVVEWVLAETGTGQVTLLGMSLGAIPSVAVAVDRPELVNAVVLDSPVAMGIEIQRFQFLVGGRSEQIIAALDAWLLTENIIDQMRQPVLVFLDEQDTVTPAAAVELLYEQAGGPKQLVRFAGLGHAAGQFVRTDEYRTELDDFLEDVWLR